MSEMKLLDEENQRRVNGFLDQYRNHPLLTEETAQKVADDMKGLILDGLLELLSRQSEPSEHPILYIACPIQTNDDGSVGFFNMKTGEPKVMSKLKFVTWLRRQGVPTSEFGPDGANCFIMCESGQWTLYRHIIKHNDLETLQEVQAASDVEMGKMDDEIN